MMPLRIRIFERAARQGIISRPALLAVDVPEAPEENDLLEGFLLREVRDGYPKWAHLRCPRCGEHIQLPLAGRGAWSLKIDWLTRPTIHPSIWQKGSCKAHFFIVRGEFVWTNNKYNQPAKR